MATIASDSGPEQRPAVVGFARAPWAAPVRPGQALQWALLALILANLGRVPVLSTGSRDAAIVLNDVCVMVLVGFTLVAGLLRRSFWIDRVAILALAFALVGLGSAISAVPRFGLSTFELMMSLSYLARWLAYFGVYLFVINNVRAEQIDGVWQSLVKVILVFTGFGVFQSFFLPDFAQMVYPESREYTDWDPQGHRLVSTVLDPNIAGAMILLVLLVQLAQIASGTRIRWWQPALLLVGLALTLSRSAILALITGLVVIAIARGISIRLIKLFSLIVFLSLGLIPKLISFAQSYSRFDMGQGSSAGTRLLAWLLAVQTIADHPVIGVGFNTYGYVKERLGLVVKGNAAYGSDGGLLFVAVMTGAVGLVLYLGMLGVVVSRCRRIWNDVTVAPEWRGLAVGAVAGMAALCVQSVFANSLFVTFVMEMMWVLWGLTFVIARSASRGVRGGIDAGQVT